MVFYVYFDSFLKGIVAFGYAETGYYSEAEKAAKEVGAVCQFPLV